MNCRKKMSACIGNIYSLSESKRGFLFELDWNFAAPTTATHRGEPTRQQPIFLS